MEERDPVKSEETCDDVLPTILIPIYMAFQKLGPEFTYTDLYNYLKIRVDEENTAEWELYERLLYSLKQTYIEFRNKEDKERYKKHDKKMK